MHGIIINNSTTKRNPLKDIYGLEIEQVLTCWSTIRKLFGLVMALLCKCTLNHTIQSGHILS